MDNGSDLDVLVIDDNSSFADLTETFLEQVNESFVITTKNSGEAGLSYFNSNEVDCIVCDYDMLELDGIDVLREVREKSDVPFILFTGRGSKEIENTAISNGANEYLRKEGKRNRFELLASRIQTYVKEHSVHTEKEQMSKEKVES